MCGIVVELNGDEVVRVRGDPEHPVTRGYVCPKGCALPKVHHHPQRLERPLIRTERGLQPTSWDHVLDDLARRLREVIDKYGPSSVGIFYGSGVGMDAAGYRMSEALQRAIGTPAKFSPLTIDGCAKTFVASAVGGFPGFSARPDYERIKLVIYIGINPMVSHGHTVAMPNPAMTIRGAARQGEVWVIDPLHTETARFATRHVAPLPGTDYAILAYLIRELLREGANEEVLARATVDSTTLRRVVEPFTRERAAEIAGVSADDLSDLLVSVRKAGRLAVETGTGVTMSEGSNLTQWLAWVLMIVTDSMNRPGGARSMS
jgi:anaerobic selenocysteine-containing dehydrogenase